MAWEIRPDDGGARITSNGIVTFFKNTSGSDKEYTIIYTSGSCSCSGTVTIAGSTSTPTPPTEDVPTGPGGSTDVVHTMDNIGRVCKTKPIDPCLACFACESGWWSGPLDGANDGGLPASGSESDRKTSDSIRYPKIGTGTTTFVSSYTSADGAFKAVSNSPWLKVMIEDNEHYEGAPPGCKFSGYIHYLLEENTSNSSREGTVTITTTGGTCDCDWESGASGKPWMTSGKVYIYQRGKEPCSCGGGGTTTPVEPPIEEEECNPTNNSSLNTMLSKFDVGTTLSVSNTPCTYHYIQQAFTYDSTINDQGKSFLVASVLAELIPYRNDVEKIFKQAAKGYGGTALNLSTNETTYTNRINGCFAYARFKHYKYKDSQEWAEKAREELRSKGISNARMRSRLYPSKSNPVWFEREDGICIFAVTHNDSYTIGSNLASSSVRSALASAIPQNNGDDVTDAQNLIDTYRNSSASNVQQALKDKKLCAEYICNRFDINASYAPFVDLARDPADAGTNFIKANFDRYRPGGQQKKSNIFNVDPDQEVYLCNASVEFSDGYCYESGYDCADDIYEFTDLNSPNVVNSFPSGHSSRAFMMLLAGVEIDGGNALTLMKANEYCRNRNVVRAHWKSDVIAGKLSAAMQIGYLNGFEEYHKLLKSYNSSLA